MMAMRKAHGLTLIELVVCLVILSILASMSLPVITTTLERSRELQLRETLRMVRTSIDRFHDDWLNGRISKLDKGVSEDGYPKTLETLVTGVDTGLPAKPKRYYLRTIPPNPFFPTDATVDDMWRLRAYGDPPDSTEWGGKDVYDLHSRHSGAALDGSEMAGW